MKTLCIYHGHCDDGFAAAWAVRHALGDDVEFYAGQYQQEPPNVTLRDVLMVDFSYKRPVLERMLAECQSLLILDHHKTAQEDLAFLPTAHIGAWKGYVGERGRAFFDMNRSGAGIAWDFFHQGKPRPRFIDYIEDRDLWRKSLPGGDEFTIALRSYPQDFLIWDKLVDSGPDALICEGYSIQRYYRLRVEELKRSAYIANLGGVAIWIANAPYFAASEVAGELADRGLSFGACYFEIAQGRWAYSLRSRGDFDVSQVARQFGGGGHKNAAGFTADRAVHVAAVDVRNSRAGELGA